MRSPCAGRVAHCGDRFDQFDQLEIALKVFALKARIVAPPVGGVEVVDAAELAGEETASQRAVGNEGNSQFLGYLQDYPDYWTQGENLEDLKDHLKERLPDYMVPNNFERIEEIPLTPSGKADRKALPEPQIVKK